MRNLVVVIALGVALLAFSVVAILAPRDALLRAGDVVEPYVGALARAGELAAAAARDVAKPFWDRVEGLVGTGAAPGPTPSEVTRASDGMRVGGSAAEEATGDVAKRLWD